MSVRVKLKNLTTSINQMGFDHNVPLIQVHFDTQESKKGLQVHYMYVEKCRKKPILGHFFAYIYRTWDPFFDF